LQISVERAYQPNGPITLVAFRCGPIVFIAHAVFFETESQSICPKDSTPNVA